MSENFSLVLQSIPTEHMYSKDYQSNDTSISVFPRSISKSSIMSMTEVTFVILKSCMLSSGKRLPIQLI